jgi:hypothetical protein
MSLLGMMTFGIVPCEVRSAAVSAMLVIPEMLAICSKVGAAGLGDPPWPFLTRWHSALALVPA